MVEKQKKKLFVRLRDELTVKNIGNLTISDENFAKVVPFRIFSLAIHPTESKLLVAAGDKWGSIGFWDVQNNGIQVVKVKVDQFDKHFN